MIVLVSPIASCATLAAASGAATDRVARISAANSVRCGIHPLGGRLGYYGAASARSPAMPTYQSPYDPSTMPTDLKYVIYEKKGHVAYVTINRPEVRNALHSYTYAELRACWRDIGLDPEIYVGIVTGTGEAFCAGRDVKFLAGYQAQGKRTPHEDTNNPLFHWGGGGQPSDANLEKPLIAAINGFAVGVGLSLALQCQLRVMADTAWIGDTHTKVGRLGSAHNLYTALPRTTAA